MGCSGLYLDKKQAEASIDKIFSSEKATYKDALDEWGIDRKETNLIDPVIVAGPLRVPNPRSNLGYRDANIFMQIASKSGLLCKNNGKIRGCFYGSFILGFTEKQVLFYEKNWNVYDTEVSVTTREIFYRDVTSVSVESNDDKTLIKLMVGGESFNSGYINKEDLREEHIQGVKNLIREKKSQ